MDYGVVERDPEPRQELTMCQPWYKHKAHLILTKYYKLEITKPILQMRKN